MTKKDKRPYRKGVVVLVIDEDDRFLVLQLNEYDNNQWNFLGGGRKKGETEEENLFRELKEELGCGKECFEVLGKSKNRLKYLFPSTMNGNYFKGQVKDQFLVRFTGEKKDIKIQEDEIKDCKWVLREELKDHLLFLDQHKNAMKVIDELFKL